MRRCKVKRKICPSWSGWRAWAANQKLVNEQTRLLFRCVARGYNNTLLFVTDMVVRIARFPLLEV
jgi:hypothetical protein